MSFWAIYVAAIVTAWAVVGRGRAGRMLAAVGFASAPAALLLYWWGFFPSFCWLIVWHLASAFYLWHASNETRGAQPAPN